MGDRDLLRVVPFCDEHIPDATALVCSRYAQLCAQEPLLPSRYTETSEILPLLRGLAGTGAPGVAAIRGGRVVGFLTGWRMPGFRGQRSTYSPEWANAAELPESKTLYGEMYRRLAAEWVSEKYVAHYVSVLPNNREAISALHWLGFGLTGVDALRGLDPIPIGDGGYEIRRAEMGDLDQVMVLDEALWRHHRGPPIFLLAERKGRCHYEGWIRDPAKDLWLACSNDQPVAFMSLGPANEDVCAIIVDDRTTSIYGAFTREDARGKGLATALLNHALGLAREAGYVRCAVDFESANPEGARFWLRYFRPVCFSLFRNVDEGSLTA